MTLQQIHATGARYALNEITGALVEFTSWQTQEIRELIPGSVTNARSICTLLFDEPSVDRSWGPICDCDARARIAAYAPTGKLLCGCITCHRL